MVFGRRDGIGQDPELVRLRRRPLLLTLTLSGGIFIALILCVLFLRERRASLLVTVDQPGAVVVLNGSITSTAAGKVIKNLRPDTYNISVNKNGYSAQPPTQIVQLRGGKTATVAFKLQPLPPEATSGVIPPRFALPPLLKGGRGDYKSRLSLPQNPPRRTPKEPLRALIQKSQVDTGAIPTVSGLIAKSPPQIAASSPTNAIRGSLLVVTHPAQGKIFVADIFRGKGEVRLADLELGELVVHYGELEGFRAPQPQKVFLSPDRPSAEVEGVYLPLIYIAAYLDADGRAVTQKSQLTTGYVLVDAEPQRDAIAGPEIKFLETNRAFAWELGYAFSNRNPAGQDFIEMSFILPENWDGVKALELRLYGWASERHYPFAAGGKTSLDIFVNDKLAQPAIEPRPRLGKDGNSEYEPIALNSYLKLGNNRIRIQTSADSRCYYYLYKIILL